MAERYQMDRGRVTCADYAGAFHGVTYSPTSTKRDAILFAAEHSRRQIYVGGYGFMLSTLARLFPPGEKR